MEKNSPETASPVTGDSEPSRSARWRTRIFHRVVRAGYLLVMAGLVVILLRQPRPQTVMIRLVDDQGKPVVGAVVTMAGLIAKSPKNWWWWDEERFGPKGPYTSGADGLIKLSYPRFHSGRRETGAVDVMIEHEKHHPDYKKVIVDASPEGSHSFPGSLLSLITGQKFKSSGQKSIRDVTLDRSAVVELKAAWSGQPVPPEELLPVVNNYRSYRIPVPKWEPGDGGVLRSVQMEPRGQTFFVAWLPSQGRAAFSGVLTNMGMGGVTNRHEVVLIRGVEVRGRLADNVPRPVVNGQVNAVSLRGEPLSWKDWTEVKPDGTFVFSSLPVGRVELAGICEGFVSQSGTQTNGYPGALVPQEFLLTGEKAEVVLRMEPSLTSVVTVNGPDGEPLAGVQVMFSPIIYTSGGNMVFPGQLFRSEELRRGDKKYSLREWQRSWRRFSGWTDQAGRVEISSLPAGSHYLQVVHEEFETKIDHSQGHSTRLLTVVMAGGLTNFQPVLMLKKGTESLEE